MQTVDMNNLEPLILLQNTVYLIGKTFSEFYGFQSEEKKPMALNFNIFFQMYSTIKP